jgi:hypothetical protein
MLTAGGEMSNYEGRVQKKALLGVDQMGGRHRNNGRRQEELMGLFPVPLEDSV